MLKWGRGRREEAVKGKGKDLIVVKSDDDRMRIDLSIDASRVPSGRGKMNQTSYPCRYCTITRVEFLHLHAFLVLHVIIVVKIGHILVESTVGVKRFE